MSKKIHVLKLLVYTNIIIQLISNFAYFSLNEIYPSLKRWVKS